MKATNKQSDPALLPIRTEIVADPFPADPKSGVQNREKLLRDAHESLAALTLERGNDRIALGLGIAFPDESLCGAPKTTISTPDDEICMHLDFARSGVEAAYKLCTDDDRKAVLLSIVADLGVVIRELRGGE